MFIVDISAFRISEDFSSRERTQISFIYMHIYLYVKNEMHSSSNLVTAQ